ncbi:MAG: hypothetical protein DRQ24_10295 [Candidatus Latescibacterota bacterium]|nr:MAG: hypothetical protein DRQ24_10295 [Candidatus Latescibacterota bacterium]
MLVKAVDRYPETTHKRINFFGRAGTTRLSTRREMGHMARIMASRLTRSKGPVAVVVPTKGFFDPDNVEGYFYDPGGGRPL